MPIRPIKKKQQEDFLEDEDDVDEVMEDEEFDSDDEYEEEYEDDYEYEERSKIIPYIVMAAALVAFVSLGWYAYNAGTQAPEDEELILIQADQTPMKEKPMDPGGMQFPYQDKSVFETITADGVAAGAPAVVSTTEEPMAIEPEETTAAIQEAQPEPPVSEVVASTEKVLTGMIEEKSLAAVEAKESASASTSQVEAEEMLVKEAKPQPLVAPVATAEAEPAPAPIKAVAASTSMSGSGAAQLGAYRTEVDANAAWKTIQTKHSILATYRPTIVRADLGEKGVFYRLRIANVDGDAMCGALKTAGQPCMKVK